MVVDKLSKFLVKLILQLFLVRKGESFIMSFLRDIVRKISRELNHAKLYQTKSFDARWF